jgi:hypothetical protein
MVVTNYNGELSKVTYCEELFLIDIHLLLFYIPVYSGMPHRCSRCRVKTAWSFVEEASTR